MELQLIVTIGKSSCQASWKTSFFSHNVCDTLIRMGGNKYWVGDSWKSSRAIEKQIGQVHPIVGRENYNSKWRKSLTCKNIEVNKINLFEWKNHEEVNVINEDYRR
jgi:hypothetical protein